MLYRQWLSYFNRPGFQKRSALLCRLHTARARSRSSNEPGSIPSGMRSTPVAVKRPRDIDSSYDSDSEKFQPNARAAPAHRIVAPAAKEYGMKSGKCDAATSHADQTRKAPPALIANWVA